MKKYILFCCMVFPFQAYLSWVLGLPFWASLIIVLPLFFPQTGFHISLILCSTYRFISIAIHIYTIVFAFSHIWWKGILTAVLPGISQIYWFVADGQTKGFGNSTFCTILLWYVFGLIITYIYMPFVLPRIANLFNEPSGTREDET